ncbi:MAG: hypothetical protein WKG07_22125 [Hymenobacter sp.]
MNDLTGTIGHGGVSLAFGLIVLVLIQAFRARGAGSLQPGRDGGLLARAG